jgi:CRP-like cAMP-binding protein/GNAT superfamily N-acetyltransferase
MITVREATSRDVSAIRDVFLACYGTAYPYAEYYDEQALNKLVYSDDTLLLVAENTQKARVVGTATVILEAGAYSDLVGEFGRLAVHPELRQQGVGRLLMQERIERVRHRLQVGIVEARVSHPYSLKIAEAHHFCPVGFEPEKLLLGQRESLLLLARYFGDALHLRKNHPRIIPEVAALAELALRNCALPADFIVDEQSPAYPPVGGFEVQELTTEGYAALLRIERGRVRHREIFGPVRLHYGFFKLQARRSRYLIAREDGRIAGAVGFTLDPVEKGLRIFELISLHDEVIRFLLGELERAAREKWDVCCVEVDVSAYAPRIQRTLLELGFLPSAYVPALVFDEVERLDVVRMVRLLAPLGAAVTGLTPRGRELAELVLQRFRSRSVLPRIARAVQDLSLFGGLDEEQVNRLAGVCTLARFEPGEVIFAQGHQDQEIHLVLQGEISITRAGASCPVGTVKKGECLGEMSLLAATAHSATATASTVVETAVLGHGDLVELVRRRPDIGLHLYRNLAAGLGEKLKRSGALPGGDREGPA